MSERVSIPKLHEAAEQSVPGNPGEYDGLTGTVILGEHEVRVLVEAVEAMQRLSKKDGSLGAWTARGDGWKESLQRIADRFDFGDDS